MAEGIRCYLTGNRDFLVEYVANNMPGVRITKPQATYLAWLDFTQLDLETSPYEFFFKKAKVALSDGAIFGENGTDMYGSTSAPPVVFSNRGWIA